MNQEIIKRHITENINKPSSLGSLYVQLPFLFNIIKSINANIVVELGTDTGSSAIAFLEACSETGGHVYSYDIASCEKAKFNIKKYELDGYWTFENIDAIEAAKKWDKGKIDVLFIDTSHTYEDTINQLNAWIDFVRKDGIILFHDTISRKDEVQKAIDDFLINKKACEYSYYNRDDDPYGLGVMTKNVE